MRFLFFFLGPVYRGPEYRGPEYRGPRFLNFGRLIIYLFEKEPNTFDSSLALNFALVLSIVILFSSESAKLKTSYFFRL